MSDRSEDSEFLHLRLDLFAQMLERDDGGWVVDDRGRFGWEDETGEFYRMQEWNEGISEPVKIEEGKMKRTEMQMLRDPRPLLQPRSCRTRWDGPIRMQKDKLLPGGRL